MSANSFGNIFKITSFGESHGSALGVVIDGCPAGIPFSLQLLTTDLERRRPGQNSVVSQRKELDTPEVLSGIFENKTLGTPITILVKNTDARSADYDQIKSNPRAGHADDVWKLKFNHTDHRGGGRSSGRETVSRVMAGSIAKMLLSEINPNIKFTVYPSKIGPHHLKESDIASDKYQSVLNELAILQSNGDSWGGEVTLLIKNPPAGLGQPVFHKLKSDLAAAMMSIGAAVGFEIGDGFSVTEKSGIDFHKNNTSAYGGIRGGISTAEDISLRVAFKPTSSILDVAKKGRHDPCIVLRAQIVVEAMAAIVLADHVLWKRLDQI